ncbi:MAG: aspartate/glutamate racemase family protein [Streptosporangiaceae bacterium]
MLVRAITPIHVGDAELRRRQRRYDRLAPAGLSVDLVDLPADSDVPRSLETADDVHASERCVVAEARQSDPERYEAVLPDCVLDPGVGGPAAEVPVPTYGILRLTVDLLAGLDLRFGAVARNQAIADALTARVLAYGLGGCFTRTAVLDLDFEAITDAAAWRGALDAAGRSFAAERTAAVVNGCSAVEVGEAGEGAVVLDPTAVALRLLFLASRYRLTRTRAGQAATS